MDEKSKKYPSTFSIQNFSSTVKLDTNIDNEKEYNPFEHRKVEHPNSFIGSLTHLLKSSLGSGILAMPLAFRNGGLVFAAIGTLVVGFVCTHCVHILVKCSHILCKRSKTPSMGFAETAGAAFQYGPPTLRPLAKYANAFCDLGLLLTYYSGNSVYVVFIADSVHQVLVHFAPDVQVTPTDVMWCLFPLLALLCQVRQLKYLVPFSLLANLLIVTSLSITLYYIFRDIATVDLSTRALVASPKHIPLFLCTVLFAMEGIGVVMPVENEMRNPQKFLGCPGVLNLAMGTVVMLYGFVGFFGYLRYGDETEATVTANLDVNEIPAQISKLCIAIAIFFTYALQFFVPMDITWRKLFEGRVRSGVWTHCVQVVMRTAVVLLTVVVAVVVNDLGHLIGLVGAIFFSLLGLLVPAVVESVTLWRDWGKANWILWKNAMLVILALMALVSGSIINISEIIKA